MINEAAALVAEVLGTEFSAVIELLPDHAHFRFRAGTGWNDGTIGSLMRMTDAPIACHLLQTDAPVVSADLRAELRFRVSPRAFERGILSAMCVVIRGRTRPWGILAVNSTRVRSFTPDEVDYLQSVANMLALALERQELEGARQREHAGLAESEARFSKIFHASPVALGMSTISEGRILDVNERWLELFGYTRHEVIGRTNSELNLSVDPDARRVTTERMTADGVVRNMEHRVRCKSGDIVDVLVSAVPVGECWITSQVDITERKRAAAERDRLLDDQTHARAEAESALQRLSAIHTITDAALSHLGLDDLLRELLARLRRAMDVEIASVRLIDHERKDLHARAVDGVSLELISHIRIPLTAVMLDGPFMTNEIQPPAPGADDWAAQWWAAVGLPLRSGMSTPLVVDGKPIGLVGVTSTRAAFGDEDLLLLQVVADRVAPAIERGRLLEAVRASRERLRTLSRRLLTAEEKERRRLAVELHDDLGQLLTAAKINLESAQRTPQRGGMPCHVADALGCVDQAMQRVRDLALDLRPAVLDDLGLAAALRWYVDRFAQKARIGTHVSIDTVTALDPAIETACFRLAQEALTNVARHAQARHVWFDMHRLGATIELNVRDDGVGFDVAEARARAHGGASLGLLGMEERATLMGGDLEVISTPGEGTTVRAHFPAVERA